MTARLWGWFLAAQVLACGFVFRDALWTTTLLAPLDIAPAMFSKYRDLNPASSGVPANHHIIDQLTYDLPLQRVIHDAYRRGEMPWWDPYTLAGRPLLADAHISGTDPVRWVLYHLLPFEAAYNWTRVVHYLFTGLGMLLLLRSLGVGAAAALLLSLGFQFAGAFAVFFGHPWVQASFLYYPFLWLAWNQCLAGRAWMAGVSAVLIGAIFYSGNLQSHSYVVLFAISFAFGRAGLNPRAWIPVAGWLAGTGLLGALLAAPVLLSQGELYSLNVRGVSAPFDPRGYLAGPASLVTAYPWSFGTFRTLDLSKLLSRWSHLGFVVFIGTPAFFLAGVGAVSDPGKLWRTRARRTALGLVMFYLLIVSTPLNTYLYMRAAPLAVMGLTVLAGLGWQRLMEKEESWRRWGRSAWVLALAAALVTNAFALVLYPRLQPRIQAYVERASVSGANLDEAKALREFQVRNLPSEISFRNPEAVLGCFGLIAVGFWLCFPAVRRRRGAGLALLLLNLLPVLLFSQRAIPRQPMSLWARLQAGGAEQRKVMAATQGQSLRVLETAPGLHEQLFPNAMAALYGVRTVHGYAALYPRCFHSLSPSELDPWRSQLADWTYESKARGLVAGEFRTNAVSGLARFQWLSATPRPFQVAQRGLNRIEVSLVEGPSGRMLWTDTSYPGWKAWVDGVGTPLRPTGPCFNEIEIQASARKLVLEYKPRYWQVGRNLAWSAAVIILVLSWVKFRGGRSGHGEATQVRE